MTEQFGLQASFNIPSGEQFEKGDMVNVRGATPEEFHRNLVAFDQQVAQLVANVGVNLRAVYAATKHLGAQQISHEQAPQGAPQTPQQAPQQPQGQPQGQGANGYANGPQNAPQGYQQQGQGYQSPYGSQQQAQQPYQQAQQQSQQQAPQGGGVPTEPPPHVGPAPQCSHGVKRFLAKPYKGGKPGYWMAWACPAQQGDNTQHELEFIRNS